MKTATSRRLCKAAWHSPVVPGQSGCIVGQHDCCQSCLDPVGAQIARAVSRIRTFRRAGATRNGPASLDRRSNYQFQYAVPNDTYSWDVRDRSQHQSTTTGFLAASVNYNVVAAGSAVDQ